MFPRLGAIYEGGEMKTSTLSAWMLVLILAVARDAAGGAATPLRSSALAARVIAGMTYYVDFENGDDANDGLSETAAWKHAPGDPEASGNPQSVALQPGDTVLFKGGMVYRGTIELDVDGAEGAPITYRGDGWGTERAILEGSTPITTTWARCESQAACGGNPNWQNIYHTDAPDGPDFTAGFFEDEDFIWQAQDPNPDDPFYYDRIEYFRVIPFADPSVYQTRTSITDPGYFTQTDAGFWDGAYVIVWRIPNVTTIAEITGFDPATDTIYHQDLGGDIYTDRDTYYAVLNHLHVLDQPGEYVLDEEADRLYVWPPNADQPTQHTYSYLEGGTAFYAYRSHHLVVEGFTVQKYTMGIRAITESGDVIIRNNTVRLLRANNWYAVQVAGDDMLVEGNVVSDCQRAVGILAAGNNVTVKDNLVTRTSRQGIWFMGVDHGEIVGNTVFDIRGTHSNGISVYLYNKDILMANNQVQDTNSSMTYHGDNDPNLVVDLVVFNNFFENPVHSWGKDMRGVTILNNTFLGGIFMPEEDREVVFINNVVNGGGGGDVRSHNVYIGLAWSQQPRYGWAPGPGEIVNWNPVTEQYEPVAPETVLGDPEHDYHLRPRSPAIDAGTDVTAHLPLDVFPDFDFGRDIEGHPRPCGAGWDMGACEFIPKLTLQGTPASQAIHLNWTVNVTLPTTSTWQIDYGSQTGTAYLPITDVISSTRAYTLIGLTNYVWYTVTLDAVLGNTSVVSDTVTAMPTDIFVYLPLTLKQ
jgi:hypothetical protein